MEKALIIIHEPTKRFKTEIIKGDSFTFPNVDLDHRYIVCDVEEKSVHWYNLLKDGYYNSDI